MNSKIKIKEKILSFFMLLIFILSFYIKGINLLWTIGNIPAWYIYRYAFGFSFMYILFAYKAYQNLEGVSLLKIILCTVIYEAIAIFVLILGRRYQNQFYILLDMIACIVFAVFLLLKKSKSSFMKKGNMTKIASVLILCISLLNVFVNSKYSMKIIQEETSKTEKNDYSQLTNFFEKEYKILNEEDASVYRIENRNRVSANDGLSFGYNGINHSSSTYSKELYNFLRNIGYSQHHVISISDSGNTRAVDMIFGIKYITSIRKNFEDKGYLRQDFRNNMLIYKNPYALSLGYSVSKGVLDNSFESNGNAFEYQNHILYSMSNINENVFDNHKGNVKKSLINLKQNENEYIKENQNEKASILYELNIEKNDYLYLYLLGDYMEEMTIFVNEKDLELKLLGNKNKMLNLGRYEIGDNLKIKIELKKEKINIEKEFLYYESEDALKKCYDILKKENVSLNKVTNNRYEGTVNIQSENEYILFTIPYDEGLRIKVNGKNVEKLKVFDALTLVKVRTRRK